MKPSHKTSSSARGTTIPDSTTDKSRSAGLTQELQRVKAGLKSALIMRQESTGARAGALASDWYLLGRIRPMAEIQAAINALTPAQIVEHLRKNSTNAITVVTLGPKPLEQNP